MVQIATDEAAVDQLVRAQSIRRQIPEVAAFEIRIRSGQEAGAADFNRAADGPLIAVALPSHVRAILVRNSCEGVTECVPRSS